MYIQQRKVNALIKNIRIDIQSLSTKLLNTKTPKPGPYVFFNISSQLESKLESLKIITNRLYANRKKLQKLSEQSFKIERQNPSIPGPIPNELNTIYNKQNKVTSCIKLDFECLYIYSGIILDLWSLIIIRVYKIEELIKKKHSEIHPFTNYIDYIEKRAQDDTIRTNLEEELLWLYYNQKNYRNRLIMHSNRPRQSGIHRSSVGDDFHFHRPSPPGRNDKNKIKTNIEGVIKLLIEEYSFIIDQIDGSVPINEQTIETLFNNIHKIKNKDIRDRISGIYYEVGGSSPSFQVILEKVLNVINKGNRLLIKYSEANNYDIDLGNPN